jgi:hypothetical protein
MIDAVLCCQWVEYFGRWDYEEWNEILSTAVAEGEFERVRRATRTGEPLGSREFIKDMERRAGRRLRVMERGRPKKTRQSADERARQGCLFAGAGE